MFLLASGQFRVFPVMNHEDSALANGSFLDNRAVVASAGIQLVLSLNAVPRLRLLQSDGIFLLQRCEVVWS